MSQQNGLHRIESALLAEGVRPLPSLGVAPDDLAGLEFAGAKDHWGSVAVVALVAADGLDAATLRQRVDTMDHLVHSLHRNAGVVEVFTVRGSARVKLGSFGIVCFVFEQGCDAQTAARIRRERRSSAAGKEYTLAWSVDVTTGNVVDHGFFPRGTFPSKRWLAGALRGRSTVGGR